MSWRGSLDVSRLGAVVFGSDAVVADSARVHAAAWKRSLDEFVRRQRRELGLSIMPFDVRADYFRHVQGRPGSTGAAAFLASRGIPVHHPSHGDGHLARALAARATRYFLEEIDRYGVAAFPAAVALVHEVRGRGARAGAVCANSTAARILAAAQVHRLFDVQVHGDQDHHDGPARPDPTLVLEATHRLGLPPAEAAVVTDSPEGVEGARRNGFAFVIAVHPGDVPERADATADLLTTGAHVVVRSLAELAVTGRRPAGSTA